MGLRIEWQELESVAMNEPELEFNRRAVRPVECLREGWQLIKDDYWLFLGICLVGVLIGSIAPFGVLSGPMVCGINVCLLRRMRGRPVTFDMLFRGFDHFLPAFLVGLVPVAVVLVTLPLYYMGFFASMLVFLPGAQRDGPPDPAALALFFGLQILLGSLLTLVSMLVAMLVMFSCPLIVEHDLSAIQALRVSARAALANLVGLFALMLLNGLVSMAGLLLCYVGAIFVLPLTYAAFAVAYRQVFPLQSADAHLPDDDFPDDQLPLREPPSDALLVEDAIRPSPELGVSRQSNSGPDAENGNQQPGIQGDAARDPSR
jgi:hypothetical protein